MSSTSSTHTPWFFSEPLRRRFTQDIEDARTAGRISDTQSLWLQSLLEEPRPDVTQPRVDRLFRNDDVLISSELAGAWVITDRVAPDSDVYFSCVFDGLQRFDDRAQLLAHLASRFSIAVSDLADIEYQRVEVDFFQQRMLEVLDRQVQQLLHVSERLQRLPSLSTALGETLQQNINALVPATTTDVFTHRALIKHTTGAVQTTLSSQRLVDTAMQVFSGQPLPTDLQRQWLDDEGRALSDEQAALWQQALGDVRKAVVVVYEKLLKDYWLDVDEEGATRRDLAARTFTQGLRDHLLEGLHQNILTEQEYAGLKTLGAAGEEWAEQVRVIRLSIAIGGLEPVKLAGIFLIDFISDALPASFLYSAKRGFRRFYGAGAAAEHFAGIDGRAEAFDHSSLNDHGSLRTHGSVHLRLDPVVAAPLMNILDSIISLQKRDLSSVLRQVFQSPAQAMVAVNEALNVFGLVHPRLAHAGISERWNDAMASSELNWALFTAPSRIAELDIHIRKDADKAATRPWENYLSGARGRLNAIFEARPTAADCARGVLNRYFSLMYGESMDARRMWLRDGDDTVVSLSVLLLEQVTGHREAKVPEDCQVSIDPLDSPYAEHLSWLTPDVLNPVLERAQKAFAQEYLRLNRDFRDTQLHVGASAVIPAHASRSVREGLLRLDLNMQRICGKISDPGLQMFGQVVDRPVFALRQVFGLQATEVSVPLLVYDNSQPAVALTNTFVLQQPLHGEGRPLLWSAVLGLREFESLTELQLDLNARLAYPGSREQWLKLINRPDRDKVRRYLKQSAAQPVTVNLARIDGDFIAHLDSAELHRQLLAIDAAHQAATALKADAGLFENMLLPIALDDKARTVIDEQSMQLELMLVSGHIPEWLGTATVHDLWKFRQLLVRFSQLYNSRKSIAQFASLDEYAFDRVQPKLLEDFPAVQLDPDLITITLTRYTPAPGGIGDVPSSVPGATIVISESLTQFAINRFSRFQDAIMSVSSSDATPLPDALNASYIRELVRTLDVGAGYEQYLATVFNEHAPDYASRLNQFIEQAPYAILLVAFRLKLQGQLSSTAYGFVENIVTMPDGVARLPVDGRAISFSPLKLIAGNGSAAGFVRAVYLITPTDQNEGPWILHAPADADFFLKEYAGQAEFLNDLKTSSKLQAMLNDRLDPALQLVYKWASSVQPALSWGSGGLADFSGYRLDHAQLVIEPMQENVLHCLFRAAEQVTVINARKRSVSTAEDNSAQTRFLVGLGAEQVLTFLPGRIGGVIGLLQARDWLTASLDSAADKQWGEATAQFTVALAVLIASRQQLDESGAPRAKKALAADEDETPHWHDPQLQFDPTGRLLPFENHDISLSSLHQDKTLNMFQDNVTLKQYVAILGKVYQVKSGRDGWYVAKDDDMGPLIKRDADNRWQLDTQLGERHDGAALTSLRTGSTNRNVEDVFTVQASGIAEIERMFPQKAVQLRLAHSQARLYLENALHNLTLDTAQHALDPRTATIIKEFFGVDSLGNVSVLPVKQALTDIYRHLVDPALSPYSSQRYVSGSNKPGYEHTNAFIFEKDPQQRIFLSERFFARPPFVRLKPAHVKQGSFNPGIHYRATTLIHEVSHIANLTHDIAYLDANVPFLDLIEDTGTYRARMKLTYEKAQKNLSHLAAREELFRIEENDSWRDFQEADGSIKGVILKVTGTSNLEAARDKFMHDPKTRAKVILSNADSVALLATLLGRERFMPAS